MYWGRVTLAPHRICFTSQQIKVESQRLYEITYVTSDNIDHAGLSSHEFELHLWLAQNCVRFDKSQECIEYNVSPNSSPSCHSHFHKFICHLFLIWYIMKYLTSPTTPWFIKTITLLSFWGGNNPIYDPAGNIFHWGLLCQYLNTLIYHCWLLYKSCTWQINLCPILRPAC